MDNIYVGIDLSLKSTGMTVYHVSKKMFIVYYYPKRKNDDNMHNRCFDIEWKGATNLLLQSFGSKLKECETLCEQYHTIVNDIISKLKQFKNTGSNMKIRLEGYAYGMHSSSSSKLIELGGILKYELFLNNMPYESIPPTVVKKIFTGHGTSKKHDMYNTFVQCGFPKLLHIFNLTHCKNIPNPIEDIVDSCAIVSSFFEPWNKSKKRKCDVV